MKNQTLAEKLKQSTTAKILLILLIILLLMIPSLMIRNLISERSGRKATIEHEVAKSHGGAQKIMMPFIKIPYENIQIDKDGYHAKHSGTLSISPTLIDIDGEVVTDTRKRSIYEVVVYQSQLEIIENFELSEIDLQDMYKKYVFDFEHAYLVFGIGDSNGLEDETEIKLNGKAIDLLGNANMQVGNLNWVESESFVYEPGSNIEISAKLAFKGTRSLRFEPLGEQMTINLESAWQDPSFVGKALPLSYDITEGGFTSQWKGNKYNHDYPRFWFYDQSVLNRDHSFGVNFIQPIDEYGKNERTAKYALLIIALTFGTFFFFEILFKKNIHPVQYTLIGFALIVFFLLLLSITEHLGFNIAYMLSSLATVSLIVVYTKYALNNIKGAGILMAILSSLFSYIFIILQMEDFALLAGTLALFVILAVAMMLSRHINWYQLSKEE